MLRCVCHTTYTYGNDDEQPRFRPHTTTYSVDSGEATGRSDGGGAEDFLDKFGGGPKSMHR
ncbi:unnamed protein product [Urochloa humidicola]